MADKLHLLIKSLSSTEKRYFQINSVKYSKESKSTYLRLFKAMESQGEYADKEIIKKVYQGEKPVNFSSDKAYLYNLLLKTLASYHEDQSIEGKVKELIKHSVILFRRNFIAEGRKLLSKAKKLAHDYEKFTLLLEILNIEKNSLSLDTLDHELPIKHNEVSEQMKKTLKCINCEWEIDLVSFKVFNTISKNGLPRKKADLDALNEVMCHPILKSEETAITSLSKIAYFNIWLAYYYYISDYEQAYKYSSSIITWIESDAQKLISPFTYVVNISNHILCSIKTDSTDFQHYMHIFQEYPLKTQNCPALVKQYVVQDSIKLQLFHAVKTQDYRLVPEVEARFEKLFFGNIMFEKEKLLWIYNSLSICLFNMGSYKQAIKYNQLLLSDPDISKKKDLHSFAMMFQLVIHFETGNNDLLEYLVVATYRFLLKRDILYKTESLILKFIKKLSKVNNEKEMQLVLRTLHTDLEKTAQEPFEKVFLEYFDLVKWLDSKTRSFTVA